MIPTRQLLWITGLMACLALLAAVIPGVRNAWPWLLGGFAVICGLDALVLWRRPPPQLQRQIQPALPVHQPSAVQLQLHNLSRYDLDLLVTDLHDRYSEPAGLPHRMHLPATTQAAFSYQLTPHRRGWLRCNAVQLRILSPWQLWQRQCTIPTPDEVRVLPDFSSFLNDAGEIETSLRSQVGARRQRRRGLGTDFHQLREYQAGDSLNQIDWKASARYTHLIAREYEAERGQAVVLMLDCSRRVRSRDGQLPHFDICLMSALRLAHTVVKQGDSVGCLTFGGVSRWISPQKGVRATTTILNQLFDVQPTLQAPDYLAAARELNARQQRRCLLVMMTNARDEDYTELVAAVNVLRKRHLVMVVSLREKILTQLKQDPIDSQEQAQTYLATEHYLNLRARIHARLAHSISHVIDAPAGQLAPEMIGQYLAIKNAAEL